MVVGLFIASRAWIALILGLAIADFRPAALLDALCYWDCAWYLRTAEHGYDVAPNAHFREDAANWAFFPLYPLLAGALARTTGLSVLTAALIVSNLAALAAGLFAADLLRERRLTLIVCTLLYFGPFSFYLATAYTEALFLALTFACFNALARQRYLAAGLAGALLSATRTVGVFIVLSLLIGAARHHLVAGGPLRTLPAKLLGDPRLVLGLALAPLGLFLYMAYLHALTGDALAFAHVQRAWNRDPGSPVATVIDAVRSDDLALMLNGQFSSQWAIAWGFLGLSLTGYLVRLRRWPEAVFAMACLALPLASGTTLGLPRYVFGTAPLLVALGLLLSRAKGGLVMLIGLVAANVGLLTLWAWRHVSLI
jgi:hypothetical protein